MNEICISKSDAVVNRFDELENRLNDHINQEAAQEDYHEEIGRKLRVMINRHSDERRRAMEKAATQERERMKRGWAALKRIIYHEQSKIFILRNIAYGAVAVAIGLLAVTGDISLWVAWTGLAIDTGLYVCNLVAYATRNRRK